MQLPENINLFTTKEFSHACGVSRTSLLRMEESGFLTPHTVDPDTGYRYYDAYNAAQVGQYLILQTLGLSRTEIADWYYQKTDTEAFIKEQRERISSMQRVLNMLELQTDPQHKMKFFFTEMPETTCYCVTESITTTEDIEKLFYRVHGETVKAGYRLKGTEYMFAVNEENWREPPAIPPKPHEITACIPVINTKKPDHKLFTFPASRGFTAVAYGGYPVVYELCASFWKEIMTRGIKTQGQVRFSALAAPFVSKYIAPDDYCFTITIPVEEDNKYE